MNWRPIPTPLCYVSISEVLMKFLSITRERWQRETVREDSGGGAQEEVCIVLCKTDASFPFSKKEWHSYREVLEWDSKGSERSSTHDSCYVHLVLSVELVVKNSWLVLSKRKSSETILSSNRVLDSKGSSLFSSLFSWTVIGLRRRSLVQLVFFSSTPLSFTTC